MATNRWAKIDEHIAALKGLEGKKVEAGWFESDRYGAGEGAVGVPVAKIARIQEFGAAITKGKTVIVIPSRPFMRMAWAKFSANRPTLQKAIARKIIEKGLSAEKALAQIGLELENCIASSIRDGGWQRNAASTIAKKGFDAPLRDTKHMFKTINSKVS